MHCPYWQLQTIQRLVAASNSLLPYRLLEEGGVVAPLNPHGTLANLPKNKLSAYTISSCRGSSHSSSSHIMVTSVLPSLMN